MRKQDREKKKAEAVRFQRQVQRTRKTIKNAKSLIAFEFYLSCYCCTIVLFFESEERARSFIGLDGIHHDDSGYEFYGTLDSVKSILSVEERDKELVRRATILKRLI